jgi:hypothetical protein
VEGDARIAWAVVSTELTIVDILGQETKALAFCEMRQREGSYVCLLCVFCKTFDLLEKHALKV